MCHSPSLLKPWYPHLLRSSKDCRTPRDCLCDPNIAVSSSSFFFSPSRPLYRLLCPRCLVLSFPSPLPLSLDENGRLREVFEKALLLGRGKSNTRHRSKKQSKESSKLSPVLERERTCILRCHSCPKNPIPFLFTFPSTFPLHRRVPLSPSTLPPPPRPGRFVHDGFEHVRLS